MKKTFTKLLYLFIFISCTATIKAKAQNSCPDWEWANQSTGTSSNYMAYSKTSTTDNYGNIYTTGYVTTRAIFGNDTLTPPNFAGATYIAKINDKGVWQWVLYAGPAYNAPCTGLVTDSKGNVYATGNINGTAVKFGNTTISSGTYIAKMDSSGKWLWAINTNINTGGGFGATKSTAICTDKNDNIIITGYVKGYTSFGGNIVSSNGNGGSEDVFIAKINSSGQWKWAKSAGGSYYDIGNAVRTDASGNIYLTGNYIQYAGFGNKQLRTTSASESDAFVSKLDSLGNWLWSVNGGGTANDNSLSITVDKYSNAYIIINSEQGDGNIKFGTITAKVVSYSNTIIAKIDDSGNWIWAKYSGSKYIGKALTSDNSDNIYVSGMLNPNSGSYISKFETDGDQSWTLETGSIGGGNYSVLEDIDVDKAGFIYATGNYKKSVQLGDTTIFAPWSHIDNMFIAKVELKTLTANAGNNATIKCGDKVLINASGTNYSSVNWSPSEGLDKPYSINPTASPAKTTTYKLTAYNICNDYVTSEVTITVAPMQLTASASKNNINCGETIQLNTTTNATIPTNYSWSPATGLSDPKIANPTARPATNTTYTVIATSFNGCTATSQVTITVNNPNPPAVGLTTSTGEKFFCNSGLTLSAAAGFASYRWNTGATTQSIVPTQPGTYTVEIIDNNGCGNKDSITLTPLTKITAPDGPYLCAGQPNASVRLDAGAGFDSYEWSNGQQTQSLTVTTTGTYSVKVTKGSCQYTTSIQVMNHPGSTNAEFTYQSNGLKTQFTTLTQGVRFVDWNFGDGKNSSALNPEHTFAQPGTYTVCLELTDFCGATDKKCKSITLNIPNGIEEINEIKENVKIYPNPATNKLVIEFEKITYSPIIITDITGRQVLNTIKPISNVITLDISALLNGLYYINLNQENYKFIKQ